MPPGRTNGAWIVRLSAARLNRVLEQDASLGSQLLAWVFSFRLAEFWETTLMSDADDALTWQPGEIELVK